jgi:hypothetical protein
VFALGLDLTEEDTTNFLPVFSPQRAILAKSSNFVSIVARMLVYAICVGQRVLRVKG